MSQILDTLAASRKLEDSGMPQAQAEATVIVVNNAMHNLVTKQHLTAEFDKMKADVDKRFSKLEAKVDTNHARLGRSMAWGFVSLAGLMIAGGSLLIAALQFFV